MKQKMKKCLCLMLSFVFVLSNCTQLFAQNASEEALALQELAAQKVTSEEWAQVKQLMKELAREGEFHYMEVPPVDLIPSAAGSGKAVYQAPVTKEVQIMPLKDKEGRIVGYLKESPERQAAFEELLKQRNINDIHVDYPAVLGQGLPTPAAEKVTVSVVPEKLVAKAAEDIKAVRHSFENLQFYAEKLLNQSQFAEIEPYVLEKYNKYLAEVEKPYLSVMNRAKAYDSYLYAGVRDVQETVLSKAARRYTNNGSRIVVRNNASFVEGAAIQTIKDNIAKVTELGPKGVHYAQNTAEIQKEVRAAFNFLGERIEYYDYVLTKRIPGAERVFAGQVDKLIFNGGLTKDSVLKYLREVIQNNPEEYRFLGVLKEVKAGSTASLDLARAWRQYLKIIGSKRANAPVLGLMRNMSYDTLKSQLSPKHQKIVRDFPELIGESEFKYASRKTWFKGATGPVLLLGTVLSIYLITEVKGDNHFGIETVSNRDLLKIRKSVENNTAGAADIAMLYTHPQSDELVEKDVRHLINSVNFGLTLQEAADNFEEIDNILSDEALAANYGINEDVNAEVQNKLDEQLENMASKVSQYGNMI